VSVNASVIIEVFACFEPGSASQALKLAKLLWTTYLYLLIENLVLFPVFFSLHVVKVSKATLMPGCGPCGAKVIRLRPIIARAKQRFVLRFIVDLRFERI
jgi:hypothetical protein